MTTDDIVHMRMANQCIVGQKKSPGDVVSWLGAIQAQDYLGSLWAVALRTSGATEKDIEHAIADRSIVRQWPMRGTLHFVAAADAKWITALLAPRVVKRARYRWKQLGITEDMVTKSERLFEKALAGGKKLSRPAMYDVLENGGVSPANMRGLHILGHLAQQGLLCFGPREGKQPTFVLLDEWVPKAKKITGDEALAEITNRYFTSHGPATIQDFMWWSGLTKKEVERGQALNTSQLVSEIVERKTYWFSAGAKTPKIDSSDVYLLASFEEYLLGYKDRHAVLQDAHKNHVNPGSNGMLGSIIIADGQVVGTWKRAIKKNRVEVSPAFFSKKLSVSKKALEQAVDRYGTFIGMPAEIV